jgi:RNA polymerase sigma-70 factor (ECF subfamily)
MSLTGLELDLGSGPKGDVCIDSAVLGLMQRTLSLEEKVAQLFELLRDPVYLYLKAVIGDAEEAQDITQETFLRLYRELHRGKAINNIRFWIFRVAHNLAFKERERTDRYKPADTKSWDELMRLLPDPGLNPEQRVLQKETFERLHAAMGWLSQQELQCLHLRAEGFRYREIGEILGINTKTAAEFLRRGIKKLMKEK